MNGHMKDWITGIAGALMIAFLLWQASTTGEQGKTIIEVKARQDLAEKVISQPVENALAELRNKTNQQAESCNKAGGLVNNNTSEIGYLKERIAKLESRLDAKP